MTRYEKIDEYRVLCGLTKKEVATLGKSGLTEQFIGQVLNGKALFSREMELKIYNAINVARAEKLKEQK